MFCRMQNNAIQCVANLQTYIVSEFDNNYLGLSNFDLWFQDTDESCCFGNGSFLFRNIILLFDKQNTKYRKCGKRRKKLLI